MLSAFLPSLNQNWQVWTNLSETSQYRITWQFVHLFSSYLLHDFRQMDRHKFYEKYRGCESA